MHAPLAASQNRVKGDANSGWMPRTAGLPPFGAVLDNPIDQRALKPDVVASFFGLNPLVSHDLFPFREKLPIQRGVSQHVASGLHIFGVAGHTV